MDKSFEIKQNDFVVKSNALVEARYRLSLQESQVILWLLTKIKLDEEDFKPHRLGIAEFAEFTKTNVEGKYKEMRNTTKRLMQRVMEIYDSHTQELLQVNWLSSAHYKYKQGYVLLEFSPKLKPYLLQLKSQFTKIGITDTLKLKSIYAIRVLELLLQYLSVGYRKITIDELRAYCGIEKHEYADYFDLKRKLIEKAKNEVNLKTEYQIGYTEIKESRKVVAIEWRIKKKNQEEAKDKEKIKTLKNELNYKSVLIKDLMDYGYSKSLATKIVKENDEIIIKNALSTVSMQLSKNQVKNPGAMLRVAIKEQWHPERYLPKEQVKAQNIDHLLAQNEENITDGESNNYATTQHFDILTNLSKILKKF